MYSPSTTAMEMKAADRIPDQMLGTTTRRMVVGQPAPSERAASASVFRSMDASAASIARYANGSTSTTYTNVSVSADSPRKYVTHR